MSADEVRDSRLSRYREFNRPSIDAMIAAFSPLRFKRPKVSLTGEFEAGFALKNAWLTFLHGTRVRPFCPNDVIDDDAKHRHRVLRILLERQKNLSFIQWSDSSEQIKWSRVLRLLNWLQLLPSVTSFMTFNNSLIQLDNQRELFRLVKQLHRNVSAFSFVFWRSFLAT